jgi:hypothetical protein
MPFPAAAVEQRVLCCRVGPQRLQGRRFCQKRLQQTLLNLFSAAKLPPSLTHPNFPSGFEARMPFLQRVGNSVFFAVGWALSAYKDGQVRKLVKERGIIEPPGYKFLSASVAGRYVAEPVLVNTVPGLEFPAEAGPNLFFVGGLRHALPWFPPPFICLTFALHPLVLFRFGFWVGFSLGSHVYRSFLSSVNLGQLPSTKTVPSQLGKGAINQASIGSG